MSARLIRSLLVSNIILMLKELQTLFEEYQSATFAVFERCKRKHCVRHFFSLIA